MEIKFDTVSIKKNETSILENISFKIIPGEHTAIIGDNGSGKSTLIDAIAGKVFPTKGKIIKPHYSEISLVSRDYSFHKIVGAAYQYYQQRYHAFDSEIGPTVTEVLQNQIIPIGTIDGNSVEIPPKKFTDQEVFAIAKLLKIENLLTRKITTLSNGETRRTLIALGLLKKPKYLLLDNPFSGLDTESRKILKTLLSQLKNCTIIIVAGINDLPKNIKKIICLGEKNIKNIIFRPFNASDFPTVKISKPNIKLLKELKNKEQIADFEYAIKFRNLKIIYNDISVVNNINWEVKKGEKWALMGPNGSGKSTILSVITTDNPQAYQNDFDLFDKKRGTGESIWDIKKQIGYVSPELHLFFNRNTEVWKTVASGIFDSAGLFKKPNDKQLETVEKHLNILNLIKLKDRKLNSLSTGEQRLVFLARALVKNPPLLILDEPCQGLDYNHMVYFRELVNEIVIELNKTLIYVTHYEEEIPSCVNKRINLFKGKVI
jgi:molybdate transport system ATP-binding protein